MDNLVFYDIVNEFTAKLMTNGGIIRLQCSLRRRLRLAPAAVRWQPLHETTTYNIQHIIYMSSLLTTAIATTGYGRLK